MGEQLFRTIKIIWRSILTVLYPPRNNCLVCGYEEVDGLCYKCLKSITFCDKDELCVGYYKGALKELILLLLILVSQILSSIFIYPMMKS